MPAPYVFRAAGAYEIAFKAMEQKLADGSDWLVHDMFGLAEINLAPFVARLEYLTLLDLWIDERPAVAAWWHRVKDRPSYRSEITESCTAEEVEEMQLAGAKIKPRIEDIRAEYLTWA